MLANSADWLRALAQTKEPSRFPSGIRGLAAGQDKPPSGNWLLDARTDEERFRRLQVYSGGTDQQMWQMGYRYEQVYRAIVDQNWQLGTYHWGKLRDVFNVALMKRPNRTPNAAAMFLNKTGGSSMTRESRGFGAARNLHRRLRRASHVAPSMPSLTTRDFQ